jgi:hypothetical protein
MARDDDRAWEEFTAMWRSLTALVGALVASCGSAGPVPNIHAIEHASVLLSYDGPGPAEFHLYSDPVDQNGEGLVSTTTLEHTCIEHAHARQACLQHFPEPCHKLLRTHHPTSQSPSPLLPPSLSALRSCLE